MLASAAAALGLAVPAMAQDRDPYEFITAMRATTDVGQAFGQPASEVEPISAASMTWDAYIQLPIKEGQDFHYTCEFDSSAILLEAGGHPMDLQQQLDIVGQDLSVEPYWEETPSEITVYGGNIAEMYSGDYKENILARARTSAVRKVFDAVGMPVASTPDRPSIEEALLAGLPVYFKSTVDFLSWRAATWVTPEGEEYPVVLTNDHALIVMGFNDTHVIIRDPRGPTTTNTTGPWQYHVTCERYLEVIAAEGNDAISVGPAASSDGTGG